MLALPAIAHAQDDTSLARTGLFARDRNVTVRQRPKPEYANSPIGYGAFLISPTITASVEGNDNIYATASNTTSDVIFRLQPSVIAQTNWSRLFAEEPKVGLLEVLNGSCTLDDAMLRDEETGAYFLPVSKSSFTPKDVFSTPAMDQLIAQARARFDIVLLDTAPVLPVADTRVIAPKADVVLFLAQWKRTPRKAIENALKQLQSVGAHVPGIALTQVDMKEQARSGYGDASYYYRAYRSYYHS